MITEKRYVRITKDPPKWTLASRLEANEKDVFESNALNFATFIRAFCSNGIEWNMLEYRVKKYFLIEDINVRLVDHFYNFDSERGYKRRIEEVWNDIKAMKEDLDNGLGYESF